MKALMLSPAESKQVIGLLKQSLNDKNLLRGLARDASGLPADPKAAKEISDRIVGTQAEYDAIMRDKGKNVLEIFADSLSKGGSKIDIAELFTSGIPVGDILDAQGFTTKIRALQDQKDKFLLTRRNDPNGVTTLDVGVLAEFDRQIKELNKQRDSALDRNLVTKIESLASRTGVTVGQEFFQGFTDADTGSFDTIRTELNKLDEARKKLIVTEGDTFKILDRAGLQENLKSAEELKDRFDILVNGELPNILKKSKYEFKIVDIAKLGTDASKAKQLLIDLGTQEKNLTGLEKLKPTEENLKKIEEARVKIKGIRENLDELKNKPTNMGELLAQVGTNTNLPTDLLRQLNPQDFALAQTAGEKIKQLNKEISELNIADNATYREKLALLQKQLDFTQAINDREERSKQISSSVVGAGKDLIKNTLTGEKDRGKNFLGALGTTALDSFSAQLSNVAFKGIGDTFGKSFSDLFGTVGESPLKPMYVSIVAGADSLLGGAAGAGGLTGIFDKLKGFGSGIGDFFGKAFSGFSSFFSFLPGFASGGVIPGASGSATPVLAHAGEVILNEAQQARVASAMSNQSQQVVNVNITGDISRQTKSEIYRMLPSIAEGVNSHNREKGLR
jgi:hypothetical protein